jgi:pimeloyl-ACP methyl ester carboxylesterase
MAQSAVSRSKKNRSRAAEPQTPDQYQIARDAIWKPGDLGYASREQTEPKITRPSLLNLASEPLRAALEFFAYQCMEGNTGESGDGHPVVIFPGLATSGTAVEPLRKFCAAAGYAAYDWNYGVNIGPRGDVDTWLAELVSHVEKILGPHKAKATLIGWSLGGFYAREIAKVIPRRVRRVITIGTPFNGGTEHTNVGWLAKLVNSAQSAPLSQAMNARLIEDPPVATTSIYSRQDGIVAWRTCQHERSGGLHEDIEVNGSHLGMGWNPAVLRVVADRLAQTPNRIRAVSAPPWRRLELSRV